MRMCATRVEDTPLHLVGCTPAVWLRKHDPNSARILVKLEYMNPTGSHKDRIALYMIKDALERGKVQPGDTVVEASSGNTAVSVAWVARLLGLRAVIIVPRTTSSVKIGLLQALGADVRFVETANMDEMVETAKEVANEVGGYYLDQFSNPANPRAHYETTGPELFEQAGGHIDAFVMGVGTGGTITGVGRFLRERLGRRVRIIAVVPRGSPIAGGPGGSAADRIEGLAGDYKKPRNFDESVVDEIVEVPASVAEETALRLAREEGILAGPSTGAALWVAMRVAQELGSDAVVASIAADSIQRYPWLLERVSQSRT
ncbi:Pyridoxal-5'-phosphate-dependent protein beta subunit [Pyrolobus fumarii 1A]|uniref:Pyridoxal-5'-phosphate-dependent protein beta subunit n=1 Tax=Pyrolobus fumarii (strain DSM 11204 / 1A) TaxID=694429 RepID=G0EDR1_PYRF1|nr:PLP-dependent cysteine synthase family protein [Pyrolobus fumarii]AEM38680.1 Pyridoxal-5'-phosphate-dependent protein beta subunit [Pyrolobus fumarii 1A]